jgi:hypothetical protein
MKLQQWRIFGGDGLDFWKSRLLAESIMGKFPPQDRRI